MLSAKLAMYIGNVYGGIDPHRDYTGQIGCGSHRVPEILDGDISLRICIFGSEV